jgi:hypothetical protein
MGLHVLHVLQHGATLAKEQGFVVCRGQDHAGRGLPLEGARYVFPTQAGWRRGKFSDLGGEAA